MMIKKYSKRGFTLVELMIVVAIVGVLAALAIYGVRKYIANAKTAEARNSLGQITKDASGAYNRENMAGAVLGQGATAGLSNRLCVTSLAVPLAVADIGGKKYQSAVVDWTSAGWACLKFTMQEPQYYQYLYTAAAGEQTTFNARATGNLDNDADFSVFQLDGAVQGGVVNIAPNIVETLPEE